MLKKKLSKKGKIAAVGDRAPGSLLGRARTSMARLQYVYVSGLSGANSNLESGSGEDSLICGVQNCSSGEVEL